jgi:phosphoglycerate dehydrogenase-like enzyme
MRDIGIGMLGQDGQADAPVSRRRTNANAWIAHDEGLPLMGEIPAGFAVEVYRDPNGDPPSDPATVEFWAPAFGANSQPVRRAATMPRLRVVQLMSAGADSWVGRIPHGVSLCDGRGVHDSAVAEWVAAAVLSHLRGFPRFVRAQSQRRWDHGPTDELAGKRVLIVGSGSIGSALAARLEPFEVELTHVARRARPGIHAVDELRNLLPDADVVVLLVPLTPETTGMVDARFLARMPDGALLVNAARGPVVDTNALLDEIRAGRLRAALDVTDPEPLPPDNPLWTEIKPPLDPAHRRRGPGSAAPSVPAGRGAVAPLRRRPATVECGARRLLAGAAPPLEASGPDCGPANTG